MKHFITQFNLIKNEKWDLITLNPWGRFLKLHKNQPFKDENFNRIIDTQTTVGYILRKDFIPKLKQKIGLSILKLHKGSPEWMYAIDQIWKTLQHKNVFLSFKKRFCIQAPGYSDIEGKDVDYHNVLNT
jgi:hypothetical protein